MALWLTARLALPDWGRVQFRLALLKAKQSPLHMAMLVKVYAEADAEVFILVPDELTALSFPMFEPIAAGDIPENVHIAFGDESTLRRLFPLLDKRIAGTWDK